MTRKIEIKNKYESKVYIIDKIIYKLDCQCPDFLGIVKNKKGYKLIGSKIKKLGEFAETKFYAEPCKHLKTLVEALIKQGHTLKKPTMEGTDKPTAELKRQLLERSKGICEMHGCKNPASNYHRLFRGSAGGKYSKENCKHICTEHNNEVHANEFSGVKSK